jgi:acetyl esterase
VAHPDNSGWLSLLLGREVEDVAPVSLDDIPAARAAFDLSHLNEGLPPVRRREFGLPTGGSGGRPLRVEVAAPHEGGPFPVVIYCHGGGWCTGSPDTVRRLTTRLAVAGHVVVSVDYALAPEHPFPAGLLDVLAALRWVVASADEHEGDASRIFLAGDSAGANLAAATMVSLLADPAPTAGLPDHVRALFEGGADGLRGIDITGLVLFAGVFDLPAALARPGSNAGFVETCWHRAYLGPHYTRRHRHPLVSPALASDAVLAAFPPTYCSVGAEDSLLPQSLAFVERLGWLNAPVTLSVVAGLDHTFGYVHHLLPDADEELNRLVTWMRRVDPYGR